MNSEGTADTETRHGFNLLGCALANRNRVFQNLQRNRNGYDGVQSSVEGNRGYEEVIR